MAIEKREADLAWKIELACEAIIAMVKDSKRGKVVPWAKFSQAALALEETDSFKWRVPNEVIELLKSERILDLEERKETPTVRTFDEGGFLSHAWVKFGMGSVARPLECHLRHFMFSLIRRPVLDTGLGFSASQLLPLQPNPGSSPG